LNTSSGNAAVTATGRYTVCPTVDSSIAPSNQCLQELIRNFRPDVVERFANFLAKERPKKNALTHKEIEKSIGSCFAFRLIV